MKKKPKIDLEYIINWIVALSIIVGILSAIVQFIRYGDLTETGTTGNFGQVTVPIVSAQSGPAGSAMR